MLASARVCSLILLLMAASLSTPAHGDNKPKTNAKSTTGLTATLVDFKSSIHGQTYMYYTGSAVKIACPARDVVFLFRAPDWHVFYYKPSSKIYFESAAKDFNPDDIRAAATMRPGAPMALKPVSYTKTVWQGRTCTLCKLDNPQKSNGDNLKAWIRLQVRTGEYWLDEVPTIPPEVTRSIQRALGLPYAKGIPLKLIAHNNGDSNDDEMLYSKISTKQVSKDFFAMPSGYRRVSNPANVGQNQDPEIFEIMH